MEDQAVEAHDDKLCKLMKMIMNLTLLLIVLMVENEMQLSIYFLKG